MLQPSRTEQTDLRVSHNELSLIGNAVGLATSILLHKPADTLELSAALLFGYSPEECIELTERIVKLMLEVDPSAQEFYKKVVTSKEN